MNIQGVWGENLQFETVRKRTQLEKGLMIAITLVGVAALIGVAVMWKNAAPAHSHRSVKIGLLAVTGALAIGGVLAWNILIYKAKPIVLESQTYRESDCHYTRANDPPPEELATGCFFEYKGHSLTTNLDGVVYSIPIFNEDIAHPGPFVRILGDGSYRGHDGTVLKDEHDKPIFYLLTQYFTTLTRSS